MGRVGPLRYGAQSRDPSYPGLCVVLISEAGVDVDKWLPLVASGGSGGGHSYFGGQFGSSC